MSDFITKDANARRFQRLNKQLFVFYVGSSLAAYFLLPFAARAGGQGWICALLPLALVANGYWATLHEAIHGQLLNGAARNRYAGRILAIFWGSSFRLLRFGHLMHHRFNRHKLDRPDSYDPTVTKRSIAYMRFFTEMFGGLYIVEIITPLVYLMPRKLVRRTVRTLYAGHDAPMPRLRALAEQALSGSKGIAEIRQDALLTILMISLALFAWGANWPAFAAFLLGRGVLVSLLDNVYHFRTPLDRVDYAYNLSLPVPIQAIFLNMNLHRVHHRQMHLPWWQLPEQFIADREYYDGTLLKGALQQLKGPISISPPSQT